MGERLQRTVEGLEDSGYMANIERAYKGQKRYLRITVWDRHEPSRFICTVVRSDESGTAIRAMREALNSQRKCPTCGGHYAR